MNENFIKIKQIKNETNLKMNRVLKNINLNKRFKIFIKHNKTAIIYEKGLKNLKIIK